MDLSDLKILHTPPWESADRLRRLPEGDRPGQTVRLVLVGCLGSLRVGFGVDSAEWNFRPTRRAVKEEYVEDGENFAWAREALGVWERGGRLGLGLGSAGPCLGFWG